MLLLLQLLLLVKVCFTVLLYLFILSCIANVDLNGIKRSIKSVLVQNQVDLKEAFDLSLSNVADELVQVGIISKSVHKSPTYDNIIGSFVVAVSFIDNLDEVKGQCDKFLSALSNVGGPVAFAVNMLRREWDQVMHED